jgi:hypothetical protein
MSELKIKRNKEKISKLLNQNIDLDYNLNLKRFKRFSEEIVNIGSKKEPKEIKVKIGYWTELFYDEDYPKDKKHAIKIERRQIIEVEGQKSNGWDKITYYSADDI